MHGNELLRPKPGIIKPGMMQMLRPQNMALAAQTAITWFKPPFNFEAADHLITNFHLPKTTLLVLVSAFMGEEFRQRAYEHAIRERYRFYSYGDAMLIL